MKKIDFSAIRKGMLAMLFMMCTLVGFSQGTDDFNTATTSSSYTSFTTNGGWSCVNTAVFAQTSTYSMGDCGRNYVVINGKTTAVGAINSPALTGGCGTLSFSFGNIFAENNGASFQVTVTGSNSLFDTTVTVANSDMTKGANLLFTADVNIEGDFTIAIANLSPSHSTSNKDRLAIGCIEWSAYGAAPVVTVAAPVFNPEGGNYFAAQNVTISTETANAAIYYTIDGSDPRTNGLVYGDDQLLPIDQTTTVKAVAILGTDTSNVTTATYTLNIPVEVATIAAFKAAEGGDNNTIYKITNDVTVVGQYSNKYHTFIQDATGGLYIYGTVANEYNPGDVISGGVYGKQKMYNGLMEMTPAGPDMAVGTPGAPVQPVVATLADVIANYATYEGRLVTIENLVASADRTFGTSGASKELVANVGEDAISLYNTWGGITNVQVSEGQVMTVTGYIIRYNDKIEILPRSAADIKSAATLPYYVDFDQNVDEQLTINNGENTNKWFIGQAQGFDNNKLYISSSNGLTNKYDVTKTSTVTVTRDIIIPAAGATVNFDYRVNGEAGYDYLKVAMGDAAIILPATEGWESYSMNIPATMAGQQTLTITWSNNASSGEQFPAAIDNIEIVETSCIQPTALTVVVDSTTANVTWEAGENMNNFVVEYKLADHSDWYSVNTTENTVVLSDLQGNSNYDVRVQSVCGEASSAWVEGNFVVDCQNLIVDTHRDYKVIGTEAGASTYSYIPFYGLYNYAYSQQIVDANEINATSGTIYSVSFKCSTAPSPTSTGGIRIWLANTDKATFSSKTDYINPSELTEVYVGPSSYAYQSGWNEFVLTTPFEYTGGNLVVAYYEGNSSYSSSSFYVNSKEGSKAIYHYNDNESKVSYTDPASNTGSQGVTAYRNVMKFDMNVVTEICGDVETCPAVTNVQVDNITPNSAELTWNRGNESETNFKVEYYAEGSTEVVSVLVEDTAYTLSDLAQLTNYTVKVQALCGENNTSEPVEIEFATLGICPSVSDIQSSNASNTTTLTWTPGGEETAWLVQFKPAEAGDNEWISINVNALPTTTFGGLMATTTYDVRVKALCDPADEENQSEWANHEFTSGCAAFDVPFAETFDSYNMPTCWDVDGFRFSGGYAYSYDLDAWIMTPAINIPSDEATYLAFDVKGYGNFSVMASYRGTDASRFAEIYSGEIESGSNYTQVVVPMADNLKGRQVYFKIVNNADQYQYIDNLSVDYCPFVPANLTATNITENSAVLTWECAGEVNNFQVKVGENIVDVEGAKTYTLTGLDASTSYTFSVRTQCGEESFGKWSAEAEFTTACPSVTLPYTEDFESSTCPADCWTIIYASGDPSTNTMMHTTDQHSVGQKSFRFSSMARVSPLDQYLISPELANHGELLLTFDYKKYTSGSEQFRVGYSTTTNNISAFTWGSYITNATTSWQEYSQTLPAEVKYIAIDYNSDWQYYLYIDNFNVMAVPTCGVPTIAVNGTTANITRSTIGAPESYDLQIGNQIETVPATQTTVDLASIFTLAPSTTYSVSVRANCGEGDYSEWSQAVSFMTPCAAYTAPYFEGFENGYTNGSAVAGCISQQSVSGSYSWTANTSETGYNRTPRTGSWNAYLRYSNTQWMYIPMHFEANKHYVFEMYARQDVTNGCTMKVAYGTSNTSSAMTNTIVSSTNIGSSFVKLTGTFAPTATGDYYVGIYAELTSSPWYVSIDDISITEEPFCVTPSIASVVPGTTDATVTVAASENAQSYEVVCVLHGEDIETGTPVVAEELTAIITGLTPATQYDVYARAICSETETSDWSDAYTFFTECAAYALPFTENFDSYTSSTTVSSSTMPICWSRLYTGTSTSYGAGIYPSTSYSRSGANSLRFYNYGSGTSASYGDAYAILPEMAANINVLGMELYARKYSSSYSSNFEVGVVTDVDNPANSFVSVQTIAPTSTSYEKFEVSFAEYTGANGHIAFRMLKPSSTTYAYIDDITVKQVVFEKDLALNSIDPIAWACDQSDARVTINVENAGITDTITSFEARYVINTQAPVSETVNCNLAPGETMSYTFNTTPVFEDGENTVHAIVDMEGDMQEENNYTDPIIVSLLEPETVPYTPTLSADLVNKGWNVVDANNDGITMDINAKAIVYTFNDTLAANDWMFTPCIEMPAGTYNVYYDYRANSSLNEKFEVFYGAGANVAAMTNEVANHDFNNTDYETVMQTITVAEDGIYNFGFHAMSLAGNLGFNIANFKVYPVVEVTVNSGENGTVTPNGVVPVNYGENLSLSIVPNTMYHVAGVWVDDVQVMSEDPYNSNFMIYTLENVTEPHNVFVDYKLEYHIIKSVANYNPAYTDVPGEFIPAATDTLIDPDPVTVNFAAAPHYHLYSLEMAMMNEEDMVDVTDDVVDNGDHTYSYLTPELVVANYYYKATFRRDTVNIHYIVETGKGYIDASDLLEQGANYDTWVDYSVAQDVNHTSVFVPYTTGDAHTDYHVVNVTLNDSILGAVENYTIEDITATQNVAVQFGYEINATIRNYVATYLDDATVRGTIEPATQLVAEGDATVVTGTIEEHFHLYNIFVDGVDMINDVVFGADGSYTLTLANTNANYNIEAVVKIDTFAINYNVLAGRGYADQSDLLIAPATYSTIVNYGDDFLTNLVPAEGFRIENVVVDGVNMYTAPNYQYNFITESHNIDVTFTPNTYTVTVNAYGQGTVSDNLTFVYDPENPMNYDFFATPAEGYHIEAMYLNGEVMEDMPEFAREGFTAVIEDVHENMTFDVHFAINTYTVDVTANAGGTTNIQGTVSYNYGENVTVTATAEEGRYIQSISVDGDVTNYTQADNMTVTSIDFPAIHENHEVIVVFDVQKFSIVGSIDATANQGTINYASSFAAVLDYGGHTTLNFQPNANYQVADVVVDGQSVGAVDSYEFVNVTANHEVVVSFGPVMYTLTATSNVPSCTITPATTTIQAGENVNYTMTVANGYHLLNVIANGQEIPTVNNTFIIENVQSDYTISANFAPNNVTVTVAQPEHATITPGTMTYAYGATPTYVIIPQTGYEVASVTAGNAVVPVTYNNGIGTFTLAPVTADITLTATTAIKTFTITVINNAHGTIAPATQTVNYGANVTFTITPDQFYTISDVKVDGANRGAISSYTFNNVTSNHTIEALYEAACYEPTNLATIDITTTSAVLTWVGTAPSYEVRYRKAADANWNTQTVTVPTVSLTGLDSNTLYAWEVRAYCTAQLQSEWVANSFMTRAGASPYDPTSIASAEFNTVKVYSHLNNVYVVNENGVAISSIAIFDINGKQVYTGSVNGSTEVISLNVANGSYIVRLASENGVGIYKVSIVR